MPFTIDKYKVVQGIPFSNEQNLKDLGFEDALKKLEESNLCFYSGNAWCCSACRQQLFVYWKGWGWKLVISPALHKKQCPSFNQGIQMVGNVIPSSSRIDLNALSKISTSELTVREHNDLIANVVRHLYLEGLERGKIITRKGNPNDDYIWHL